MSENQQAAASKSLVGRRFVHKHWLDERRRPQTYQITAVRHGDAYYHPVYVENGVERIGKGGFRHPVDRIDEMVKEWIA